MEEITSFFLCKKISDDVTLYSFDLNKVPNKVDQIIYLSTLITKEQEKGNICYVKLDKRIRAKGLFVVFSNDPDYYKTQILNKNKNLINWDS